MRHTTMTSEARMSAKFIRYAASEPSTTQMSGTRRALRRRGGST